MVHCCFPPLHGKSMESPHCQTGGSILPLCWLEAMGKGPEAGRDMQTRKLHHIKYLQDRGRTGLGCAELA